MNFVNRLVNGFHPVLICAIGCCNGSEYFSSLGDNNFALLRHIMLFHHYHILRPVHREWNRLAVQHIAIAGLHLNQFILAMGQFIRKHQPAFLIGKERVNGNRRRVIDRLRNQIACRQVADLEPDSGRRDDFPGLRIMLLDTDKARLCRIVQDIGIGLVIGADVYNKIRDERLPFHALSLMHNITPIGEVPGNRKPVCVRSQDITFSFPCRIIAACAGKIDLEHSAFLRLLNDAF